MSRRPAFTLLETIIALAIGIIVMGAALAANRVIQQNAQVAKQQAQEESIVNDTFGEVRLTLDTVRSVGATLASQFMGLGTNAPLRVAPYRIRQQITFTATTPERLKWCTPTDPSCTGLVSPVGPTTGQFTMGIALSANSAEMVAVRRGSPQVGQPQIYDLTYLPATGSVLATTIFGDNPQDQAQWDFYRRWVTVTNRNGSYGGYVITVNVWPMIGGQNRPANTYSRTVVYTDY